MRARALEVASVLFGVVLGLVVATFLGCTPRAECCALSHDGQCGYSSSIGCAHGPQPPRRRVT
jgi:hypothetical protein